MIRSESKSTKIKVRYERSVVVTAPVPAVLRILKLYTKLADRESVGKGEWVAALSCDREREVEHGPVVRTSTRM